MIQTPWSVSLIMDKNFIFVVIAASICGCYNNEANRPEPFQGRFAKAIENHRFPKTIPKPDYLNHYGVISASEGNKNKTILYHVINLFYVVMKHYARNSIILFQGQKKLQINMPANSSGRQATVSMKWQHQFVRRPVTSLKVLLIM